LAVCDRLKLTSTWPVAPSEAELKIPPLPDQTMYWPPEAPELFCTLNGEKLL
jgi:hypothetical protein